MIVLFYLFISTVIAYCSQCEDWQKGSGLISYTNTNVAVDSYNSLKSMDVSQKVFGLTNIILQNDGNLVLYDNGKSIWASNTKSTVKNLSLVMQADGNLVLYADKSALWSTKTNGKGTGPYCFSLQDDRNMVVYDNKCAALWASNTGRPAPKADPNGNCYFITVKSGDYCQKISQDNGITLDQLKNYNTQTWQWLGCDNINTGMKVCISPGNPPKPTIDPKAECGPLSKDNKECPLKACCSQWGYCGITKEFCEKKTSITNNPGTTGCISNCDIKFVKGSQPASNLKIGYYETWNQNWPCLNQRITNLDWSKYTHVHYSFGDIINNKIVFDKLAQDQFESFKSLNNIKKIVSLGGWGLSTEKETYQNLRIAVQNPNPSTDAIVKFINDNNLDGIDIDWEYPGALDIPGIPSGLPSDGPNYLNFLRILKSKLPNKSVSIAVPASYWYLKAFPVDEMSKIIDYAVFMTYDLHGQWDYSGNEGPYLRSHVNWTETQNMVNLITHAGYPSNKLLLGIAKYGRSFKQADPNCYGPTCKFTGPDSGALPGKCTGTNGYLAIGEINDIIKTQRIRYHAWDKTTDTRTLAWGNDQWVAYIDEGSIRDRENWVRNNNLLGTVVWAVDLDNDVNKIEYKFGSYIDCLDIIAEIDDNISDMDFEKLTDTYNLCVSQGPIFDELEERGCSKYTIDDLDNEEIYIEKVCLSSLILIYYDNIYVELNDKFTNISTTKTTIEKVVIPDGFGTVRDVEIVNHDFNKMFEMYNKYLPELIKNNFNAYIESQINNYAECYDVFNNNRIKIKCFSVENSEKNVDKFTEYVDVVFSDYDGFIKVITDNLLLDKSLILQGDVRISGAYDNGLQGGRPRSKRQERERNSRTIERYDTRMKNMIYLNENELSKLIVNPSNDVIEAMNNFKDIMNDIKNVSENIDLETVMDSLAYTVTNMQVGLQSMESLREMIDEYIKKRNDKILSIVLEVMMEVFDMILPIDNIIFKLIKVIKRFIPVKIKTIATNINNLMKKKISGNTAELKANLKSFKEDPDIDELYKIRFKKNDSVRKKLNDLCKA